MATHPACIHTAAPDIMKEATEIFRNYLLADEAQQLALTNGLRPVNEQVTLGAPLDVAHGVDLNQPEIVFSAPTVNTIYAIQDLWQAARKDVNLVMLLDISGSMRDDKIENMRGAAIQFVEQMGDDDFITIVAFSKEPILFIDHEQVGTARPQVLSIITDLYAGGDTALYDAIGLGGNLIADSTSSQATNVMVVLTDGQDTNSTNFHFGQHLIDTATANDTTVFTIAYGGDAEEDLLSNLAQQANGNFYLGTKANIDEIYQEMSAAFGGNVGIGR